MDTVDLSEPRHHSRQHSQSQSRQQKLSKTGTWLPAEDVRLCEAVAKYGTRWVRVAGEVGSRNGDQCAKRWNENLNPELDHSPWTPKEVSQIGFSRMKAQFLVLKKQAVAVVPFLPRCKRFYIAGRSIQLAPISIAPVPPAFLATLSPQRAAHY